MALSTRTPISAAAVLITAATAASLAVACGPVTLPAAHYQFSAASYGAKVTNGQTTPIAPTGQATLTCTTNEGQKRTVSRSSTSLTPYGSFGASRSVETSTGGKSPASNGSEDIANVSLLGGIITANSIHVQSGSGHNSLGFLVRGTTTFSGLKINGHAIANSVAPGTVVTVAGKAVITLNITVDTLGHGAAQQSQTAMLIHTLDTSVAGGTGTNGAPGGQGAPGAPASGSVGGAGGAGGTPGAGGTAGTPAIPAAFPANSNITVGFAQSRIAGPQKTTGC